MPTCWNTSAAGTRLIEVKAGGHVKEEYAPDVAIQKWVINGAGVSLSDISVAHLNTRFVYPGSGDYRGLLVETPVGGPRPVRSFRRWRFGFVTLTRTLSRI